MLSFDLLLALDLSSGSVKLDVLLDWSIANAFCKLKMKKICLVERVNFRVNSSLPCRLGDQLFPFAWD